MFHLVCLVLLRLSPLVLGAPEVVTSQGKMVGQTLLSRNGREYAAFGGIPYAQPPVGDLRFMPPLPGKPWEGVLNATVPGPICYQTPFLFSQKGMQGQEDCLYINVYTPKIDAIYPVMVYVHGGAFTNGWPGTPMKPSFFMDEDVVIVTMTYRLGILGFLTFEDDVIPGNYGLKDQALALEWVKREIKNFGGNPDLITAFGISAGAASSHYLCSNAKTQGLLKGCISQSGVAGAIWSLHEPGDGRKVATDLATKIGCGNYKSSDLLTCLQSKPLKSFISTTDIEHVTSLPGPVLERPSDTAVLTQWPTNSSDFPWIVGIVANEGLLITEYIKAFGTFMEKVGLFFEGNELIVKALHLKGDVIVELFKITDRFFKWKDVFNILNDFERFFTEAFWIYPILKEIEKHTGPKYFYRFEYSGGPSLWEQIANKTLEVDGLCHGDDAPYYFNLSNYYQPKGWPGTKDVELSKTLVKMWVNFASHQVPITDSLQWSQFGEYGSYLHITNNGLFMKNFTDFRKVINFWNDIK